MRILSLTFLDFLCVLLKLLQKHSWTRLHSSRMRTARVLTVSPSMLCAGGCMVPGGRVHGPRGVHGYGGWGGGGGILACTEADPPLWTEWQTGVKLLPCPKLRLRAVTILIPPSINEVFVTFSALTPDVTEKQDRSVVSVDSHFYNSCVWPHIVVFLL